MATMKRLLEGCRGLVPGMGAFEVGLAAPGLEATCDVVLVSEFGSAAALEACQRHPQHLAIRPHRRGAGGAAMRRPRGLK
jgi:hypothetical protein